MDHVDHVDPGSGKMFRYHVWENFKSAQLAWYNLGAEIEVLAIAGGNDGEGSSYTQSGVGGSGGEWVNVTGMPVSPDYQIFSIIPGGPGQPTVVRTPGLSKELQPGTMDDPLALDDGWKAVLGVDSIGGKGADASGPIDATNPGGGGAGGYRLKEPYAQQSYTTTESSGGPYSYDCSYGAGCRQAQSGTREHVGNCQAPHCPATWSVCYGNCNDGTVTCCHADGRTMGGWWGGCPGGWYGCHGAKCCTQVPNMITVCDVCNNGGSASGGTCHKTCSGNDYKEWQVTHWTPCASGYTSVNRTCTDSRAAGGGKGKGGIVAIRYEFNPSTRLAPVEGTGVPIMY